MSDASISSVASFVTTGSEAILGEGPGKEWGGRGGRGEGSGVTSVKSEVLEFFLSRPHCPRLHKWKCRLIWRSVGNKKSESLVNEIETHSATGYTVGFTGKLKIRVYIINLIAELKHLCNIELTKV